MISQIRQFSGDASVKQVLKEIPVFPQYNEQISIFLIEILFDAAAYIRFNNLVFEGNFLIPDERLQLIHEFCVNGLLYDLITMTDMQYEYS